jgi:membrane-associated protease RseP (regulator of RpoE activity)
MDRRDGWPPPEAWPPRAPAPPRGPAGPRGPLLHAALFLATAATALLSGFALGAPEGVPLGAAEVLRHGWPYAAALLGVLGAHEFGHYALARRHRVDATLPFFIPGPPFPFGVGSLGAVIRLRSALPSRRATLDIGLAGPFAGLLVAVPLYAWGLARSAAVDASAFPPPGPQSLAGIALALLTGAPDPSPGLQALRMGDSLLTWGLQRLVWGALPAGQDLLLHPVAVAAWFGLLVTALNLVPLGQLDGGHATYALLGGERARRLSRLVAWGLLGCGLFLSVSWLAWWALARWLVGPGHPPAWDERPLDPARRALAVAGLVLFALTFVPVPVAS